MRATWDRGRALRTIEDIIRIYPGGAPTMVILDRLDRLGLGEHEALDFLHSLEETGKVATQQGRWILPAEIA